jgi:hypothetical protein
MAFPDLRRLQETNLGCSKLILRLTSPQNLKTYEGRRKKNKQTKTLNKCVFIENHIFRNLTPIHTVGFYIQP